MKLPQLPLAIPSSASLCSVLLDKPTSHPNVYRKRIRDIQGTPRRGDWVAVYHQFEVPRPELFAYAVYNPKSEIALRIVRWGKDLPDDAFWEARLNEAVALRRDLLQLDHVSNCYE